MSRPLGGVIKANKAMRRSRAKFLELSASRFDEAAARAIPGLLKAVEDAFDKHSNGERGMAVRLSLLIPPPVHDTVGRAVEEAYTEDGWDVEYKPIQGLGTVDPPISGVLRFDWGGQVDAYRADAATALAERRAKAAARRAAASSGMAEKTDDTNKTPTTAEDAPPPPPPAAATPAAADDDDDSDEESSE